MRGRLILAHLFSKLRLLSIGTKCAQVEQREDNEPQCQHAAHSAHASQGVQYVPCVTLVGALRGGGAGRARVAGGGARLRILLQSLIQTSSYHSVHGMAMESTADM